MISRLLNSLSNPKFSPVAAPLIWLADAVLCGLIVWKIPYTEIDWTAYMEQIHLILNGEFDYANIFGGTGPLVYPAGHVRIFSVLYYWTEGGTNLETAQYLFAGLYLATLAIVMAIYVRARVPPYVLPLLVLSKRLHSIYMLRMFNDCFTTFFAVLAVFILQGSSSSPTTTLPRMTLAVVLLSLAVGVKMSALLYLPGAAVIFLYNLGTLWQCLVVLAIPFFGTQLVLALPFLESAPQSYFSRAFEFSRVFLFKWTVNWRFLGEQVFLSREFAVGLLAAHVLILSAFFISPSQRFLVGFRERSLGQFLNNALSFSGAGVSAKKMENYPRYVAQTIALSNIIGVLCARSLHYQFYSWFYWSVPLLLFTSSMPWYVGLIVWGLQEYAWNVFPSTETSSLLAVLCLVLIVLNNWFVAWDSKGADSEDMERKKEKKSK